MFFFYHSWSNWSLERLVYFKERRKLECPAKKLSEQRREPITNSTHRWHWHATTLVGGGGWVLSPLCPPSPAIIIAKLHFDALCSIFSRTSFSHLATPCCVGHRHDVGWQCSVVFAGLYECCTVQFRSAYTLVSFKPGYIYSCMPFSSICWITFLVFSFSLSVKAHVAII